MIANSVPLIVDVDADFTGVDSSPSHNLVAIPLAAAAMYGTSNAPFGFDPVLAFVMQSLRSGVDSGKR